jgi:hypothetical protein
LQDANALRENSAPDFSYIRRIGKCRSSFEVRNSSFEATNDPFEVCNASLLAANASRLRYATCFKFGMAHFKQRMPRLQFATPHSLLQMPRGSGPQHVSSFKRGIRCLKYLIPNLESLVSSKEWLICVKRAASPPHLRHNNEPRCAELLCTKQHAAALRWFFWHAVEKMGCKNYVHYTSNNSRNHCMKTVACWKT